MQWIFWQSFKSWFVGSRQSTLLFHVFLGQEWFFFSLQIVYMSTLLYFLLLFFLFMPFFVSYFKLLFCVFVFVYTCMWRSEDNLGCHYSGTLLFETASLARTWDLPIRPAWLTVDPRGSACLWDYKHYCHATPGLLHGYWVWKWGFWVFPENIVLPELSLCNSSKVFKRTKQKDL